MLTASCRQSLVVPQSGQAPPPALVVIDADSQRVMLPEKQMVAVFFGWGYIHDVLTPEQRMTTTASARGVTSLILRSNRRANSVAGGYSGTGSPGHWTW